MQGQLILIVDNEHELLGVLADALTEVGFRVEVAVNGLQALQVLARELPAVILLDMHMPVLDGLGFIERLAEYGAKAPIIVMSGYSLSRQELQQLGATAFIAKPFDIDVL